MFGYLPDAEITEADTMLPFLDGEQKSLVYAVRKTYFPNVDSSPRARAATRRNCPS